jgi:site-specific recombinase XerD
MLTIYYKSPFTLKRLRSGPSGPYFDGFAHKLHLAGYSQGGAQRLLRAAAHLGVWGQANDSPVQSFNKDTLASFQHHLSSCCCPKSNGGRGPNVVYGAKRFLEYLNQTGVVSFIGDEHTDSASPQLMTSFFDWLQQHRGTSQSTCRIYGRVVVDLLQTLGDDPNRFTATDLQAFALNRAGRHGRSAANIVAKALRMFLRYLIATGQCSSCLIAAIPTFAHRRLSSMPRYISATDVERIIEACDPSTLLGARDRAILLLLARLALRAGDIVVLQLTDISWDEAILRFVGKGRRETRLPLTQEIGDAILTYLQLRGTRPGVDALFLSTRAPMDRPLSSVAVSALVARAIKRAGIVAPSKGAHLLRHSAATEMLRQGLSLEDIGAVLRHRSMDTTAHYAKVDLTLLREITRPWPEVTSC